MTATVSGRSPAHLTSHISAAAPGCPEQPDRAEQGSPRSGALDRPATRSYAVAHDHRLTYHPHPTAMIPTPETGCVKHTQISEIESEAPHGRWAVSAAAWRGRSTARLGGRL